MKKIYPLLIFTGLLAAGAGLILSGTGCDEIKAPCDIEETDKGTILWGLENLESWRLENGYGILRFTFPRNIILFVCTDRTLTYQATVKKYRDETVFTTTPEARLVWKYAAPKPSKATLTGLGAFKTLFEMGANSRTLYEDRIALAYTESAMGGFFIPGLEIKITSFGNRSDDFNFVYNNFSLILQYDIQYRLYY
jgi:hypothetical protein